MFCVLALIWPILLLFALWLHFANKGAGAFFTQERPGKDGMIFQVIKFTTMTDDRDTDGNLLPDAQRLTKVGRFVRSTSIDELPQLINVFLGQMSLVGPRPLPDREIIEYGDNQDKFLSVKPGMTGWWPVSASSTIGYPERCHLDLYYVEKCCFTFDVLILLKTIGIVLKRVGAR